jgi:cytochrome aa3-600 menaquinol oxidase subunit 1
MLSFVGAGVMAISFALIVYNVYYSIRYSPRNIGSDPWDARSLEWATHTPVPEYNFAVMPQVNSDQTFWDSKKKGHVLFPDEIAEIHMPNNSGLPFIMSAIFFVWGFSFVFAIWPLVIISTIGIFACMAYRSFEKDHGRHISVKEIKETEEKLGGAKI